MMSSGQNNSSSSSNSNSNKISPRKFSEKIALLNKKEAEGNAEFEEIIKEVQATRSQSANEASKCAKMDSKTRRDGRATDIRMRGCSERWRPEEREELEQVFRSLIEGAGQYDSNSNNSNSNNNNEDEDHDDDGDRDRDRDDLDMVNQYEPGGRQLEQQSLRSLSVGPQAELQESSYQHSYSPHLYLGNQQQQQQQQSCLSQQQDLNAIMVPFQEQPQPQPQPQLSTGVSVIMEAPGGGFEAEWPACRTRFASIGSAMYGKLRANNNGHSISGNENGNEADNQLSVAVAPTATCVGDQSPGHQMSLGPGSDRSWQKSCSDPTLNVASQQQHTLKCDPNNLYAEQENNNYQQLFVGESRMICDQDDTNLEEARIGASYPMGSADDYVAQQQQQEPHYRAQATNEVPGIKICNIDDDGAAVAVAAAAAAGLLSSAPNPSAGSGRTNEEDSLPDLTNLQFASSEDVANFEHCQQTHNHCCNNSNSNSNSNTNDVSSFMPAQSIGNCSGRMGVIAYKSVQPPSADYGWSSIGDNLYAPKVNNVLSVSECGLTSQSAYQSSGAGAGLQQMGVAGGLGAGGLTSGGIMRSHSHNSIDNLVARRTFKQHNNTPTNLSYQGSSNHQSAPHNGQQFGPTDYVIGRQYDADNNERHHFLDSAGYGLNCRHKRFHQSLEAQHGSVSPVDSSLSNLTSPRSEQNSPGSSNNEYGNDYLPYSTAGQQQSVLGPPRTGGAGQFIIEDQQRKNIIVSNSHNDMRPTQLFYHQTPSGQQQQQQQQQPQPQQQQEQQQHFGYVHQHHQYPQQCPTLAETRMSPADSNKFHSFSSLVMMDQNGPGSDNHNHPHHQQASSLHRLSCRAHSNNSSTCELRGSPAGENQ